MLMVSSSALSGHTCRSSRCQHSSISQDVQGHLYHAHQASCKHGKRQQTSIQADSPVTQRHPRKKKTTRRGKCWSPRRLQIHSTLAYKTSTDHSGRGSTSQTRYSERQCAPVTQRAPILAGAYPMLHNISHLFFRAPFPLREHVNRIAIPSACSFWTITHTAWHCQDFPAAVPSNNPHHGHKRSASGLQRFGQVSLPHLGTVELLGSSLSVLARGVEVVVEELREVLSRQGRR